MNLNVINNYIFNSKLKLLSVKIYYSGLLTLRPLAPISPLYPGVPSSPLGPRSPGSPLYVVESGRGS